MEFFDKKFYQKFFDRVIVNESDFFKVKMIRIYQKVNLEDFCTFNRFLFLPIFTNSLLLTSVIIKLKFT